MPKSFSRLRAGLGGHSLAHFFLGQVFLVRRNRPDIAEGVLHRTIPIPVKRIPQLPYRDRASGQRLPVNSIRITNVHVSAPRHSRPLKARLSHHIPHSPTNPPPRPPLPSPPPTPPPPPPPPPSPPHSPHPPPPTP